VKHGLKIYNLMERTGMPKNSLLLFLILVSALVFASLGQPASVPAQAQDEEFVFGLLLVGPFDDHGWSEAHYEGGLYVEDNVPGTRMVYIDKFNPADSPELTMEIAVEELIAEGARLIIANSDDMKEEITAVAPNYPDVTFIHISGDGVLTGEASPNLGNIMGQMEYGKMMGGCAAALMTQSGHISYLGPLINHETLRLVNSAYLGARHCWETYRGGDPAALTFEVTWIGFWFNIPGVTLDPTEVANGFVNSGADVLISGIDTTEALVVAGQRTAEGQPVFAVPYDFRAACTDAPEVCLGVPYFNWGPAYVATIQAIMDGTWEQSWDWNGPDWTDLNNPDTTAVGFEIGEGLSDEAELNLVLFIEELALGALGETDFNLYAGPLLYQDGAVFVEEGEVATPEQIWYTEQLLQGITGLSSAEG
jgi:simple sugar transport system substrate-binding protein